jgi:uncharacterized protein YoxC
MRTLERDMTGIDPNLVTIFAVFVTWGLTRMDKGSDKLSASQNAIGALTTKVDGLHDQLTVALADTKKISGIEQRVETLETANKENTATSKAVGALEAEVKHIREQMDRIAENMTAAVDRVSTQLADFVKMTFAAAQAAAANPNNNSPFATVFAGVTPAPPPQPAAAKRAPRAANAKPKPKPAPQSVRGSAPSKAPKPAARGR